jgi:hypothetical protein
MATTGKNGRFKQQKQQLQNYAAKASSKVISNYRGPMKRVSTTEGNKGVAKTVTGPLSGTRYKSVGKVTVATTARRKAKNPNSTKSPGRSPINVGARQRGVATVTLRPGKPTQPYAGRAKPTLRKKKK